MTIGVFFSSGIRRDDGEAVRDRAELVADAHADVGGSDSFITRGAPLAWKPTYSSGEPTFPVA